MSNAREAAKATKCLSNMRQLAIAYTAYVSENGGVGPVQNYQYVNDFADPAVYDSGNPNTINWLALLMPYLSGGNVLKDLYCPSASDSTWTHNQQSTVISITNYMANQAVLGRKVTMIPQSSQVVLAQEDRFLWDAAWLRPYKFSAASGGNPAQYGDWCWDNKPTWGQEYSYHHRKGGNLAFVDGHAEWRHNKMVHPIDFGLSGIPGKSDDLDPNTVPQSQPYYCDFDLN